MTTDANAFALRRHRPHPVVSRISLVWGLAFTWGPG